MIAPTTEIYVATLDAIRDTPGWGKYRPGNSYFLTWYMRNRPMRTNAIGINSYDPFLELVAYWKEYIEPE